MIKRPRTPPTACGAVGSPFKSVVVIRDLDALLAEPNQIGWSVTAPRRSTMRLASVRPAGTTVNVVSLYVAFVRSGPMRVELIETVPGTIFAEAGLHHMGVFVDDLTETSERLVREGWPRLAWGLDDDDHIARTVVHGHPLLDCRIGLVPAAARAAVDAWCEDDMPPPNS
ncbi:MAG: VOC family protein [Acidimicrobiia bacterium]